MANSLNGADQPDEPIGAVLVRWRKRRKLTGQALGALVGMNQTRISRLETGVLAYEPDDVRRLAAALNIPSAETERLVELAEHLAGNRFTLWTPAGQNLAGAQHAIGRLEAAAKVLRVFQPTVFPGLTQTSEYARAIMGATKNLMAEASPVDSDAAVSQGVNNRIERSSVLDLPDHQFHFLITEQVLRNRVCESAQMVAQIGRMRELAGHPNVFLRIITDDVELPIPTYHGFVVADDRWVIADLFHSSDSSRGAEMIRAYRKVFDALEGVARADVDDLLRRHQERYAELLLSESVEN